jgi:hypothetical protein
MRSGRELESVEVEVLNSPLSGGILLLIYTEAPELSPGTPP